MRTAYQIAVLPLLVALPVSAFAQDDGAGDARVSVTGLSLTRPAVEDPLNQARTQVSIHVAAPPANVVGLGRDSQITRLEDDTGHSLLVEHGPAEEDQTEPFRAPPGLTWRYPSPPGAAAGFLRRDTFTLGGREGWIEVFVDAPELPARDAAHLEIAGTIALLVAGDDVRRQRVDGIDLSDGEAVFEIGDEMIRCTQDRSFVRDDTTISEFYCWSQSLQPRDITVADQDAAPFSPDGRANLVVTGDTRDLSLEFAFPVTETLEIRFDERVGLGL